MIYSEKIKEKLPLNRDKLYVVADFDKTITKSDSQASWGILSKTNYLPKQYTIDRQNLYNTYRPIEIDNSIDEKIKYTKMQEWYKKHVDMLVSYKLPEEVVEKAINNEDIMKFRDGAKEFLDFLNKNNIPLIIISAGIGNFIKLFLKKYNCYYSNINIVANTIKFENGIATGIEGNIIIHSLNKNEIAITQNIKNTIQKKEQILLLGDQIEDLKMISEEKRDKTIRVGFLNQTSQEAVEEYKKYFDIVCEEDTSYTELQELLF